MSTKDPSVSDLTFDYVLTSLPTDGEQHHPGDREQERFSGVRKVQVRSGCLLIKEITGAVTVKAPGSWESLDPVKDEN